MLVVSQLSVLGAYFPPVFVAIPELIPPHTIISLPVHTAVWESRPVGTFVKLVAVQRLSQGDGGACPWVVITPVKAQANRAGRNRVFIVGNLSGYELLQPKARSFFTLAAFLAMTSTYDAMRARRLIDRQNQQGPSRGHVVGDGSPRQAVERDRAWVDRALRRSIVAECA